MAIEHEDELKDEKNPRPLDEDDIALLKTYVSLNPNFNFYLSFRYFFLFGFGNRIENLGLFWFNRSCFRVRNMIVDTNFVEFDRVYRVRLRIVIFL